MLLSKTFAALCCFIAAASSCSFVSATPLNKPVSQFAPLLSSEDAIPIQDSYIVVLKDSVSKEKVLEHQSWLTSSVVGLKESEFGLKGTFSFSSTNFQGYVGKFTEEQLELIRASDDIAYVERDQLMYINDIEVNAPWGLSRISNRYTIPEDHSYVYPDDAGEGVTAYIVDTGININHVDFEGRAVWGKTIPSGDKDEDGNGHGTHVAGTVGGKKYGVAKKVKLVAVKVLRSNGSGSLSDVILGIEWVATAHQAAEKKAGKKVKSVANMSLGGGKTAALDAAANAAVTAGVHFAVAAGNDNADACNYSPAAAVKPITVGATTIDDEKAWFSNYGRCVDIFAPGHEIESAWIGSSTATNTISGTSMASPHVCGAVAALLTRPDWGSLSPAELKAKLKYVGVRNVIRGIPLGTHTPNKFLFIPPSKE